MLTIPIVFDKFNRPHMLINNHKYHITQMVYSPTSIGDLENIGSYTGYTRYRIEYLKEEDYEQISNEDGLVLIRDKVFCCKTDFKTGSKGLTNVTFEEHMII